MKEILMLIQKAALFLKGGPGSGNFGHGGRPGERGGSSTEGATPADEGFRGARQENREAEDIDDWASDFAEKKGSALDIWMSQEDKAELKRQVDAGAKVRCRSFNVSENSSYSDKLDSITTGMKAKGFTLFRDESNYDSGDAVFIKPAKK
jgi:hypothetical protein